VVAYWFVIRRKILTPDKVEVVEVDLSAPIVDAPLGKMS